MKKVISLVLALVMVLSIANAAFAATLDATANVSKLNAGETVSIDLSVDEAMTIANFQLLYKYDPDKFELESHTLSEACTSFRVVDSTREPGTVKISKTAIEGTFTVPAGVVCTLVFKAKVDIENVATAGFEVDPDGGFTTAGTNGQLIPDNTAKEEIVVKPTVKGYTATLSTDQTKVLGENAVVEIAVANAEAENYNAYKFVLGYDTDRLTFVAPEAQENVTVEENNGTITVIGYGKDKACDTDKVALTFTAKATGEATVTLETANIDAFANANVQDAPAATIVDNETVITIGGYTVTLPEEFTGEGTVGEGEEYTFEATDKNYDYEITATMGGEAVVPAEENGVYTIADVSGNIVVTLVNKTAKEFNVTVDGTGKDDVTAAEKATYMTDYTFTVAKDALYNYTVNANVALTHNADDSYTIEGEDITKDITITVEKTAKPTTQTTIEFVGKGSGDVKGGSTQSAENGKDFTFEINAAEGFVYEVKLNGEELTAVGGVYTIPGAQITGETLKVTVEKTAEKTVEVTEYVKLSDAKSIFLVTVKGAIEEGKVYAYDGTAMFFSEGYDAYAYLVVSSESLEAVKADAEEKIAEATATAAEVVYDGDVNKTNVKDINDAQLVWNMYNAKYENFEEVTMDRFLGADMNGDKALSVADSAAIVALIK